jgi:glycosyltransferase involved in cell wall biosynthesis
MYKNKTVCVITPTKNEEKNLKILLPRIKNIDMIDEVIVVDSYSTDKSRKIAEKYGFKVIFDNRKGKGEALKCGAKNSKSDILIFMDADCSHAPEDIPKMVKHLVDNKLDLVIGSRTTGGSDELSGVTFGNFIRLVGSHIINLIINKRFKAKVTDYHNGFRAIRKKVLDELKLKDDKFAFEQEMGIKCLRRGYKIGEVPAHEYERIHGQSTLSIMKVGPRYVWATIKYCFFSK